jgi:hypothetical protein
MCNTNGFPAYEKKQMDKWWIFRIYVALREIIPHDFFRGKKDMDLTSTNTSS